MLRSPLHEDASIQVPTEAHSLSTAFNGSICSKYGDEYLIKDNIIDLLGENLPKTTLAQDSNFISPIAKGYEDYWRVNALSWMSDRDFPIAEERHLIGEWIRSKPNQKILDLACSTALYARLALDLDSSFDLWCVDFSLPMLLEAKTRLVSEQKDAFLLRTDAEQLPFYNSSFDVLLCGGSLNEFRRPAKALYEARRVLKPDGTAIFMHLLKAQTWWGSGLQSISALGGIQFWNLSESNTLFERAGFQISEQQQYGIVCFTLLKPD